MGTHIYLVPQKVSLIVHLGVCTYNLGYVYLYRGQNTPYWSLKSMHVTPILAQAVARQER